LRAEHLSLPGRHRSALLLSPRLTASSASANAPVPQGRYTTLDDPTGIRGNGTFAIGISAQEDIVGTYIDDTDTYQGFVLRRGHYTRLADPKGTKGTLPYGISAQGDIVGTYQDSTGTYHGFLLHQGRYTTLNDPRYANSGTYAQGTYASGINAQGDIVGNYTDSTGAYHGFLLRQGRYTTLDDPKAADGTYPAGISAQGDIVGAYSDGTTILSHGFLRRPGP
jgi:probable HAF family extracellular repeat protein